MAILNSLKWLIGNWQGVNHLWLDPKKPARTSDSTADAGLILNAQTFEINYTWADLGQPQAGKLLLNQMQDDGTVHAVWFDSWHMAKHRMVLSGSESEHGVDLRGGYAAPPGPDWGWRIAIEAQNATSWRLQMFNISPEGHEDLAVEVEYSK